MDNVTKDKYAQNEGYIKALAHLADGHSSSSSTIMTSKIPWQVHSIAIL